MPVPGPVLAPRLAPTRGAPYREGVRSLRALPLLLLALSACGGDGGPAAGPVPSDFTLTDLNPSSPTTGEARTLSAMAGTVVVIYFVSYT